ncbi:keratin, type II cytoskeletal 2 epidermal-like [Stomoxys calcitrans]|uniref:keratin, type II cytoskeletal 2 epidermal-like n=1 Tax=Stomoxys calcitrans TaxID=35570 RepID=UPI0027E2196C|nr:keratin, type II cytoskeletal 2 epidermal-like [Stomoxys calcitrans]
MRGFIVLCLVASACAQSGYNYQKGEGGVGGSGGNGVGGGLGGRGLGGGDFGASGANGGLSGSGAGLGGGGLGGSGFGGDSGYNAPGSSLGGSSLSAPSFGSSAGSSPSFGSSGSSPSFGASSPSFGGSSSSPSFGDSDGPDGASSFDAPEAEGPVEKQFITYTAEDQDFVDPQATEQFANSVKQGLRVVFIKGPDNSGLENAAIALAKQASDQKTDVYVLNKQADLAALANKLNAENSNSNNKPDVHFVKYRTPEDAANAQKTIQAEYDALGGKSENIDGGVASSLNFASQAPVAPAGQHGSFGAATSPSYLPASIFRRYRF